MKTHSAAPQLKYSQSKLTRGSSLMNCSLPLSCLFGFAYENLTREIEWP